MSEQTDRGPWAQTYSGVAFYLLAPSAADVRLRDIAHALALINRFAGHTFVPYSVAEHSVRVSWAVPPELALAALLHDAAEAYTNDIPRPMKMALVGAVRSIEDDVARAIGKRFGVELVPTHPAVKHADNVLLATEARDLMGAPPVPWELDVEPVPWPIEPWGWEQAEAKFIERFLELGGRHGA